MSSFILSDKLALSLPILRSCRICICMWVIMDKIMLMIMYLCYNFYILCSVLK